MSSNLTFWKIIFSFLTQNVHKKDTQTPEGEVIQHFDGKQFLIKSTLTVYEKDYFILLWILMHCVYVCVWTFLFENTSSTTGGKINNKKAVFSDKWQQKLPFSLRKKLKIPTCVKANSFSCRLRYFSIFYQISHKMIVSLFFSSFDLNVLRLRFY